MEDARHTVSLTQPLHEVVRTWQLRAAAGDGDAFMDAGQDDSDFVDLDDVLGSRP
ncbi:hypothetical protein ACIGHB_31430 [Streptomyces sp. NPDC085460]|uniref:hypothetical protein n=1 Tax=Streptomyces sp. NPDC085460 TaxID=3365723 RepID=UPI0037D0C2F3